MYKWFTGSMLSVLLTSTLWTPLPAEERRANDERQIRSLEQAEVAGPYFVHGRRPVLKPLVRSEPSTLHARDCRGHPA